ncbi:hypothetical protein [Halorientalis pallida]|uniref:Uncharacterized protein n=1 Tax=Halorientalis pallida TaxID=2479928 RepID=A0A498L4T9_9EURY|nr:hypothetical protein [Halorientalis pallida]RXK51654.1 hypothetical protein EAF64_03205 [Halorientalis pallida]
MPSEFTRRKALRLGAATASVGAVGSVAGCSSIPFLGGGGKTLAYNDALFAPGDVPGTDEGYVFTYSDYKLLRDNEDNLENGTATYEDDTDSFPFEQMGVGFDSTDANLAILAVGGHTTGSFEQSDVGSSLEDNGFSEDGSYSGYTLYAGEQRTVGVEDGAAVYATARDAEGYDRQSAIETIVDTKAGDGSRYAENDDDYSTLDEHVYDDAVIAIGGTGGLIAFFAGDFENVVGWAISGRFDGGTQEIKSAHVFGSEGDANVDAVEQWARDSDLFVDATDLSAAQDGRVVTVSATGQAFGGAGSNQGQ